jgi:hypothetical protein
MEREKLEVEEIEEVGEQKGDKEARKEFRLAWMWVEGWRGRLRAAGDIVERERYEWSERKVKNLYTCL